ncbi:hypothetical protein MITS9509_00979 [Synechococcus sp. MIT S9509]|uniref:hypothetical protein n=1 Tax=Synechococcus sp. MIT S9509 TaxID=1801630 RepID=UPI0007BB91EB|nr:hypothetical protein [Synechococcus sp. MIT S9509]KZR93102.1 hypothetical protein MITS9509_00979 [Synechococcus sp. MIT S9509]
MGKKATKAEVDRRIHEIVKLLCSAKTNSYIRRYAAEEWGSSERQADRYLVRAREIIQADYSIERHEFMASRIALLDKIAEKSIAQGQHSNAVGAIRLQAELTRLLDKN